MINQAPVQTVILAGQRFVILPESDYHRLTCDNEEPPLPEANERGNYPALETSCVLIARDFIRARRRLGLSQEEVGRLARVRLESLRRAERGQTDVSHRTLEKIERALARAEKSAARSSKA